MGVKKGKCLKNWGQKSEQYSHDLIADGALDFIRRHRRERFFLYVPFTIPHFELLAPEDSMKEYRGQFPEPWAYKGDHYASQPEPRTALAAMITRMDRDVGREVAEHGRDGVERADVERGADDRSDAPGADDPDAEGLRGSQREEGLEVKNTEAVAFPAPAAKGFEVAGGGGGQDVEQGGGAELRLERHPALRAGARLRFPHLRVHRADEPGVRRRLGGGRGCRFGRRGLGVQELRGVGFERGLAAAATEVVGLPGVLVGEPALRRVDLHTADRVAHGVRHVCKRRHRRVGATFYSAASDLPS